jgi:hypothetical protein
MLLRKEFFGNSDQRTYNKEKYLFVHVKKISCRSSGYVCPVGQGQKIFHKSGKNFRCQKGDMKQVLADGPQIFGATIKILFAWANWCLGFFHLLWCPYLTDIGTET